MLSVGLLLQFLVIFSFFPLFRSTCFVVFVHFCLYVIRFPFDIFFLFEFGGRECICVTLSSSSLLAIEKFTGKRRWREEIGINVQWLSFFYRFSLPVCRKILALFTVAYTHNKRVVTSQAMAQVCKKLGENYPAYGSMCFFFCMTLIIRIIHTQYLIVSLAHFYFTNIKENIYKVCLVFFFLPFVYLFLCLFENSLCSVYLKKWFVDGKNACLNRRTHIYTKQK